MTERNGFERVRDFVVTQCRQAPGGVARITNQEAGEAAGITGQAAGKHLKFLVLTGVLAMLRRSVYSVVASDVAIDEPANKFQKGFKTVSIETPMKPDFVPETAGEVSIEFQKGFNRVSKPRKDNYSSLELKSELESELISEEFGKNFFWGVSLGNGILREGVPETTDDLDAFVDWQHPKVLRVRKIVEKVFQTKSRDWSVKLTDRIVFGMIYGLNGFDLEELKKVSEKAKESAKKCTQYQDDINKHSTSWRAPDNPYRADPWMTVAPHVKLWISEACSWTPTELSRREKIKEQGERHRKQLLKQQVSSQPGMVTETPPEPAQPLQAEQAEQPSNADFNTAYWEQVAKRNPTLYQKLTETESHITLPANMTAARSP